MNLERARFLADATLLTLGWRPLKMFHGVVHIDLSAIYASRGQRIIQKFSRRADNAAQSLLGKGFSVTRQRGKLVESDLAPFTIATVHPSSILRAPDAESREQQMCSFVDDLKQVVVLAGKSYVGNNADSSF